MDLQGCETASEQLAPEVEGSQAGSVSERAGPVGKYGSSGLISTFLVPGSPPTEIVLRHRNREVEPPDSSLLRVMGAAVWPAAVVSLPLIANDPCLRARAARGGSILELGAGHGLSGLACALLPGWQRVVITDKSSPLVELISDNIARNLAKLPPPLRVLGAVRAAHLVWGHSASLTAARAAAASDTGYDLILAAGCTYSPPLLAPFFDSIAALLAPDGQRRAVHRAPCAAYRTSCVLRSALFERSGRWV